jgi:hypothetical protein
MIATVTRPSNTAKIAGCGIANPADRNDGTANRSMSWIASNSVSIGSRNLCCHIRSNLMNLGSRAGTLVLEIRLIMQARDKNFALILWPVQHARDAKFTR